MNDASRAVSEHVFEIRYRPNARILDKRGEWAEELSVKLELPLWHIQENRLDVFDPATHCRGFVSFGNAGYVIVDAATSTYFGDHAIKFLKFILGFREFSKPLHVERIGVRQRFLTPFGGKFEELVALYSKNYVRVTDAALETINGKLIDIGAPLNFADQFGNFNTNCGPMPRAQAEQFFKDLEVALPDVGLYYDIDYWLQPKKAWSEGEIQQTVKNFSLEGWQRHTRVRHLIIGA